MAKGVIHVLKDFITLLGLQHAGAGLEDNVVKLVQLGWNY